MTEYDEHWNDEYHELQDELGARAVIAFVVAVEFVLLFLLAYFFSPPTTGDTMRGATDTFHLNGGDSIVKHVIFRR